MLDDRPLRVLLIRPGGRFVSRSFPDGPMVAPPRPLLYLQAAVADDPGITVRILDALAEGDLDAFAAAEGPALFGLPASGVAARAADWEPDVVGVTVMASYYRPESLDIARAIRAALPDAFIVFGGPDPTVDAERYLADGPIDAVCIGEGEATFAELMHCLAEGRAADGVAGLALPDGGGVRRTAPRPMLAELDRYVPDYSGLDLNRYAEIARRGWRSRPTALYSGVERTVDVVTTRGCPYRCSFCVIHASMGRRFRTRSIDSVMHQLQELVEEHGVRHVHFEDDIINLDRKRFGTMLDALIEAGLPLTWDTPNGVRADLLDAEIVRKLRPAGCAYLIFGIESGSQRVLDEVVDKEMQLERVVDAARLCSDAGIDTFAFYIVGMPGETRAEAEQTVAFAFDLFERFGTTPLLQIWRPYVQTALHDQAEAAGHLAPADPAALHAQTGIPYTQFRDRSGTSEAIDLDALAAIFADYSERLAKGQLERWRQAGVRPPLTDSTRQAVERFVLFEAPYLNHYQRRSTTS